MIRIQYAVLLGNIEADQAGRPLLRSPITNIVARDMNTPLALQCPLFVTFVDGSPGEHKVHVDIITPSGSVISLPDFGFDWSEGKASHGEAFTVGFQLDVIGLYTLRLTVDDEASTEIPLPVVQQL